MVGKISGGEKSREIRLRWHSLTAGPQHHRGKNLVSIGRSRPKNREKGGVKARRGGLLLMMRSRKILTEKANRNILVFLELSQFRDVGKAENQGHSMAHLLSVVPQTWGGRDIWEKKQQGCKEKVPLKCREVGGGGRGTNGRKGCLNPETLSLRPLPLCTHEDWTEEEVMRGEWEGG